MPKKLQTTKVRIPQEQTHDYLNKFVKTIDLHCPFCGNGIKEYKSKPRQKIYKCGKCKTVIYNPKTWITNVLQNYQGRMKIRSMVAMQIKVINKGKKKKASK